MTNTTQDIPSPVLSRTSTAVEAKGRTVYAFRFLPARGAVFLFVPILLICSVCMAVGGSIIAQKLERQFSDFQRLTVFFHILNYVGLAVATFVGLYGAFRMRPKAAQFFVALLLGQLLFGIASGAMCMHILFKATVSAESLVSCSALVQNSAWIQSHVCGATSSLKGLVVGGFLIMWSLEIVTIYVSMRLSKQLQEAQLIKELNSQDDDYC